MMGKVINRGLVKLGAVGQSGGAIIVLADPQYNSVVAGVRYDMSAEEVIEWCRDAN